MKKYLLVVVCLFSLAASVPQFARAQAPSTNQAESARHWPSPDEVVAKMDSKLSLSDDQKAKITPIIEERQEEKIKSLASEGGRRRKKAREIKSIMEDSDKKIKALLSDDQKKKYDELQQEMRQERRQAHHVQG